MIVGFTLLSLWGRTCTYHRHPIWSKLSQIVLLRGKGKTGEKVNHNQKIKHKLHKLSIINDTYISYYIQFALFPHILNFLWSTSS